MAITLYGIRNCDTMKKARAWLEAAGVVHVFHDYKTAGIERRVLEDWVRRLGWESLFNRSGTTYRKLSPEVRDGLTEERAVALMCRQPTLIRRPVLDLGDNLIVGFKPETYERALREGGRTRGAEDA